MTYIVHENSFRRPSSFPVNLSVYEAGEDDARPLNIPVDFFGSFSVKVDSSSKEGALVKGTQLIIAAKAGGRRIETTLDVAKYLELCELEGKDAYIALIHSPKGPKKKIIEISSSHHFNEVYRFDRAFPDTIPVMQFFAEGGKSLFVCRMAGLGSQTAWCKLSIGSVWASSPGEWGNKLKLKVTKSRYGEDGGYDIDVIDVSPLTTEHYFNVSANCLSGRWFRDFINNTSRLIQFQGPIDILSLDGVTLGCGTDGFQDWWEAGVKPFARGPGTGLYSFNNFDQFRNVYLILPATLDRDSSLMGEITTWCEENGVIIIK
jgi:hypothetical protein